MPPFLHQHAPRGLVGIRMRPMAGGFFDKSGAGRTQRRPRAAALPGTLWFLIDEVSTPPPHTAGTAMPPSLQRRGSAKERGTGVPPVLAQGVATRR